jgi:hypothetical protein
MKSTFLFLSVFGVIGVMLGPQATDYQKLKAQAEQAYAEGSFSEAYESYKQAKENQLPAGEKRWVAFRLADAHWRAQASTQTADSSVDDAARRELEDLARDDAKEEGRDRVWAEAQESLGDFWWMRRDSKDWGQAWGYYSRALEWWAGAKDIEQARRRYVRMVWAMAAPPWRESYYYYGYYGNVLPVPIIQNVLKIADNAEDRTRAHYLLAMTLKQQWGDWPMRKRVGEEFEQALKTGKKSEWHDDALYHYAEWLSNNGNIFMDEEGGWHQEPDFAGALRLYRKLLKEYQKGETAYYDGSLQAVEQITRPDIQVFASNIFLPDTEIEINANWRNIKQIDFSIYKMDLLKDIHFISKDTSISGWLQTIDFRGKEAVTKWTKALEDKGDHKPGIETVRLKEKLPAGAYLLVAEAGGQSARDLILVTSSAMVLKTCSTQTVAYVCDAVNGSPLPNAKVKLWTRTYEGGRWNWSELTKETERDGLAAFDVSASSEQREVLACSQVNEQQAFVLNSFYSYRSTPEAWRLYAFTDKPAYKPEEEVRWKVIARTYDGTVYSTPARTALKAEIRNPQGATVKEESLALNTFGSAWGSLPVTKEMVLGEYTITFYDKEKKQTIGSAPLFRLEEYKLPEFKVSVTTPLEDGKLKLFQPGDVVEAEIRAEYYFGGPVTGGSVEVLVHQNPYYRWWHPCKEYAWYYEDMFQRPWNYGAGQGQIVKRETLKTDPRGRAVVSFETPAGTGTDFQYRIEARVTDLSRREITGSGTVKVTRQRFFATLTSPHSLYKPQDKVTIDIACADANEEPVEAEGNITVTRDTWEEVWTDGAGGEVKGEELQILKDKSHPFPPAVAQGEKPWKLVASGYRHEDVLKQTVATGAKGDAQFSFVAQTEGYYRIFWKSKPGVVPPVTAESTVWVTTHSAQDLGYYHGGVEIIVDRDTFHAGEKAPVMISVPAGDRYVWFSIESERIHSTRLIHVQGNVKFLEIPIEEAHVPNVFLSAVMVADANLYMDTKQVVIPPVEQFLNVSVEPDKNLYKPREEGRLALKVTDRAGKPVSAEVALGVADESVFYIQGELAGDIRQYYYGSKRAHRVQTSSSFQQKSYKHKTRDDRAIEADLENAYIIDGIDKKDLGYGGAKKAKFAEAKSEMADSVMPASPAVSGAMNALREVSKQMAQDKPAEAEGAAPAVQVRHDFSSTAFWQPDIRTDSDGKATVTVKFPDSLTRWMANARASSAGNQFGTATASVRTRLPLIVRLQSPRFFTAGDSCLVSAVVNNNTEEEMKVVPTLEASGVTILGAFLEGHPVQEGASLAVKAGGENRMDWRVSATAAGMAVLKVTARGDLHADAMEKSIPVVEHGIEKFLAVSGKMEGSEASFSLTLPKERRPGSTAMMVQVAPSLAVTMLDALPYLIDYPYGCTEQTLSRFLPAVIVAKTLKDLAIQPDQIEERIFGGIESEAALKTHPKGKKEIGKLRDMTQEGLKRLYDFQHSDGGWGWWKDGESDHFMSAYVVWGLGMAKEAGSPVSDAVLQNGINFLDKELVEEETHPDMQAWMLYALASARAQAGETSSPYQKKAFDRCFENRTAMNAYARALLALSAHKMGEVEKAKILVRNLENGVKKDDTPAASALIKPAGFVQDEGLKTAHWGEDGISWRWSEGGVEATAFALKALLTIEPRHPLVEPVVNWLIKNRRGAQWNSTRDTAITLLALTDYLKTSGELNTDADYELFVNGQSIAHKSLKGPEALQAPSRYVIPAAAIKDGDNEIRIVRRSGNGALYYGAQAEFFTQEEPVTAAGSELFIHRRYFKLVSRPTLLKGVVYERMPLGDKDRVTSGERVECVITIEAKNNYEYLVFEDLKPAGLEAVQIKSGEPFYARELKSAAVKAKFGKDKKAGTRVDGEDSGDENIYTERSRWVYQELRERKTAFFIDKLPEGVWEMRYELRAEVPGTFHALPTLGYAMYVPEIRGNGAEIGIEVVENTIQARIGVVSPQMTKEEMG